MDRQEELSKKLEQENAELQTLESERENHEKELRQRKDALIECNLLIDTLKKRLTERDPRAACEPRFGNRFHGLMRENLEVNEGYESAVDVCLSIIKIANFMNPVLFMLKKIYSIYFAFNFLKEILRRLSNT